MMRAYPVAQFGLDSLQQVEVPDLQSQTAPGMVVVKVHAVSLNHRDLLVVRGLYNPRMALPRILCSDGAGEIVAVGDGVSRIKVGDRVCGIFSQRWLDGPLTAERSKQALGGDVDGMLAEYVMLSQEGVVRFPEHLSYEEASTLPCAGVTAWNALHYAGDPAQPVKEGDTVLIQGTGGVSLFALQFARLLGARVIGTSSSEEKLKRAYALGLDAGCNYRTRPEWSRWIGEVTGGVGVDRVIEVGGAGTFGQSLRAARVSGVVVQIGILAGGVSSEPLPLTQIIHKQLRVQGVYVGSRSMFEEMNATIAQAKLRPVIDQVFPFHKVREALGYMQSASHFGKIVIRLTEG